MNPEVKELWVSALRSGEYLQGGGLLAQNVLGITRYCCLGVLSEVAAKAGVITRKTMPDGGIWFGGETRILPQEVAQWADLPDPWGDGRLRLTEKNDYDSWDFNMIADLIEREL